MDSHNNKSNSDIIGQAVEHIKLNMWLIHVPQRFEINGASVLDVLKSANLELDSYVFVFQEGNISIYIY